MLFDENGIMDLILGNPNENININNNYNVNNLNNTNNLFNEKNGLIKGNMFEDEYIPYKNFKEKEIIVGDEKNALLLKIYETDFAIKDLNLYLDLHPEDQNIFNEFKKYINMYNDYKKRYEKQYGPLCLESTVDSTYEWINNPWPWDNIGGMKNV